MSLWSQVDKISKRLPKGYQINLCLKKGEAWVECYDDHGDEIKLTDSEFRPLSLKLNNAYIQADNDNKKILR